MTQREDVGCPEENEVLAFATGRADHDRAAAIASHVDGCDLCRQLIVLLARDEHVVLAMPSPVELSIPDRVSRYQIEGLLGEGNMGRVFAARDPALERDLAIKVLHAGERTDREKQVLLREARALAKLRHTNVVTVHDAGIDGDVVFVAMERIHGADMRAWLGRKPNRDRILEVFDRAAAGLAAAHAADIVHRDFKPDNVLVGDSGEVTVTDFGLASLGEQQPTGEVEAGSDAITTLTDTRVLIGTPAYMAPELHRGEPATDKSDQFAFFVSLVEAFTGERPFSGSSIEALVEDISATKPVEVAHGFPRELRAAAQRGLAHDPADRFESMSDAAAALRRPYQRRRWPIAVAGLSAAAIIAALAWSAWPRDDAVATAPSDPVIALLPFEVDSKSDDLTFAHATVPQLIGKRLEGVEGVSVISFHRLRERVGARAPAEAWRDAAAELGATHLIRGNLTDRDGDATLAMTASTTANDVVARTRTAGRLDDLGALIDSATQDLAGAAFGADIAIGDRSRFDSQDATARGIHHLMSGEPKRAHELLREVLASAPNDPDANYYLAIALWWDGRSADEVREQIERASKTAIGRDQRLLLSGLGLHIERRYPEAIAHFDRLAAANPNSTHVLYGAFETQFHGGDPARAMDTFRRIRQLDDTFRLGALHVLDYYGLRRDADGIRFGLDVLQPERGGDRGWLVREHLALGRYDEAVELAQKLADSPQTGGTFDRFSQMQQLLAHAEATRGHTRAAQAVLRGTGVPSVPLWSLALARGSSAQAERHRETAYGALTVRSSLPAVSRVLMMDAVDGSTDLLAAASVRLLRAGGGARSRRLEVALALIAYATADADALESAANSAYPDSRAIAAAFARAKDGDHAGAAASWAAAIEINTVPLYQPLLLLQLARARHRGGEHRGAIESCDDAVSPAVFEWTWGPVVGECLVVTIEAAVAAGDSRAAQARMAQLRKIRSLAAKSDALIQRARRALAGQEAQRSGR